MDCKLYNLGNVLAMWYTLKVAAISVKGQGGFIWLTQIYVRLNIGYFSCYSQKKNAVLHAILNDILA